MAALQRKSADVNKADEDGETTIHLASQHGKLEAVSALLALRASVNVKDHAGWTALHWAASIGHPAMVHALLGRRGRCQCEDQQWLDSVALRGPEGGFGGGGGVDVRLMWT